MTSFRIEPGLPPYGPPALSFPNSEAFSEGLVVSFGTISGQRWAGNFAPGFGGVSTVRDELGPKFAVVVSTGAAYLVDVEARSASEIAWPVEYIDYFPSQDTVIVGNGLWFDGMGRSGKLWRSRRISWDGMRAIQLFGDRVVGEAFTPMGPPDWVPFELDLASGQVEGGSFHDP